MAIEISCKQCGKVLRAKDELAGKRVKCPGCGGELEIPYLAETNMREAAAVGGGPARTDIAQLQRDVSLRGNMPSWDRGLE